MKRDENDLFCNTMNTELDRNAQNAIMCSMKRLPFRYLTLNVRSIWIGPRMDAWRVNYCYLPRSILRYLLRLFECFRIIFRYEKWSDFVPFSRVFAEPFCLNSGNETWFCLAPSCRRKRMWTKKEQEIIKWTIALEMWEKHWQGSKEMVEN